MITKLPYAVVEELVKETAKQLGEKGYAINQEALYQSLNTANVQPSSKKMQFKLSKSEGFNQSIHGMENREFRFFPRRVLLNTTTDYQPNRIMEALKRMEAHYFDKKIKGFDSSYVCRCAREDQSILEIMQRAYAKGSHYSLMGTLGEMLGDDGDGRKAHDEKGNLYVRKPVIVVPGAERQEIETLDAFCTHFQIPSQEATERILGLTD